MIIYAKKIKPVTKSKPKITLKKVFQGYKKAEPSKNKNKKKNKSKY